MKLLEGVMESKLQAVNSIEWIHIYDGREVEQQPEGWFKLKRYADEEWNPAFGLVLNESWVTD